MAAPIVFISYSHDSSAHKNWVLALGSKLRADGVDARLDQWELGPGSDLAMFMEKNLAIAERVIMVCSENYVAKANSGVGGVGYEKMIVTADLMKNIDSNKVVPIIRQAGTRDVPTFLKTKLFLDFSKEDQYEFSYDELVRSLHNAPLFKKPPLGEPPYASLSDPPPVERTGDSMVELMTIIAQGYEAGDADHEYSDLLKNWSSSRLFLDETLSQAKKARLLYEDGFGQLVLGSEGRQFIFEHRLFKGA